MRTTSTFKQCKRNDAWLEHSRRLFISVAPLTAHVFCGFVLLNPCTRIVVGSFYTRFPAFSAFIASPAVNLVRLVWPTSIYEKYGI